ncbi:MAG TPA: fibronectin type III domain-containing protein [Jatrophihabitans sp.]|nr:fibronectin type III domain-containing protein [Jatrophihabitans sp.]
MRSTSPDRPQPSRRRLKRRLTAVAAGLLAAATAIGGGLVTGSDVAGTATAATRVKGSPYGKAEHIRLRPGGLLVSGWAIDPSSHRTSLRIYVTVDGKSVAKATANLHRADVARAHPYAGPRHGFSLNVLVPEGRHTVCAEARNVGHGRSVNLRCDTRTLDYGPDGVVQSVTAAHGAVTVSGWTADLDNRKAPLTVAVTVDHTTVKTVASRYSSAAAKWRSTVGTKHGFSVRVPAAQGAHTVSVRVTNLGYGSDTVFARRSVTLNDSPRITLDYARQSSGKLRVRGWAFDPDTPTSPVTVLVKVDSTTHTVTANSTRTDVGAHYAGVGNQHGFDVSYTMPEGAHTVAVTARNASYGSDVALAARRAVLNFTPSAAITSLTATSTGLRVSGWASDPDTSAAIATRVSLDGKLLRTLTANAKGSTHSGHNFATSLDARSGTHRVCVVGVNVLYGTANSAAACGSITLALSPLGRFDSLTRASSSGPVKVVGWAWDPDTTSAVTLSVKVDGGTPVTFPTSVVRTDVATSYASAGKNRGFSTVIPATNGEHTVCVTATNVSGGKDTSLGCKLLNAVHPVAPSTVQKVTAQAGYGGATVSWTAPASDGGAPWSKYVVTASPGGQTVTASASATSATVTGLKPSTSYTFTVQAVNVAGTSVAATSLAVKTQASPPAQTTPAPVSTSRYIRNIRGASSSELALMKSEGATDASYNPSGHGYLVLLDIGGQDQYDGGAVLSATTRFVSYANLVKDLQAYVDGYASKQKPSAPAMIAIGTNNDMDVTSAAGKAWADQVVDPVAAYTKKKYPGITIAGANDIEPGFRGTYSQTKSWLTGYLAATSAPFVFNGSADGCSWTATNRGCNNGWTMSGLYYLAAGAAPIRMLNLPQIYNYTMADQWKYISLTGVAKGQPRINFAGTLTEWTACDQTNSCGSITGRTAWSKMWANLQSDRRLQVGSLPYATDLRIDR